MRTSGGATTTHEHGRWMGGEGGWVSGREGRWGASLVERRHLGAHRPWHVVILFSVEVSLGLAWVGDASLRAFPKRLLVYTCGRPLTLPSRANRAAYWLVRPLTGAANCGRAHPASHNPQATMTVESATLSYFFNPLGLAGTALDFPMLDVSAAAQSFGTKNTSLYTVSHTHVSEPRRMALATHMPRGPVILSFCCPYATPHFHSTQASARSCSISSSHSALTAGSPNRLSWLSRSCRSYSLARASNPGACGTAAW